MVHGTRHRQLRVPPRSTPRRLLRDGAVLGRPGAGAPLAPALRRTAPDALNCSSVTLRIGKQHELPRRPGDWKTSKGEMNAVPDEALVEAEQMKEKFGVAGSPSPAPAAPPASSTPDGDGA